MQRAIATAADQQADPDLRADAVSLIAIAGPTRSRRFLKQLIDPVPVARPGANRRRARTGTKGDDIGKYLLANWRALTPGGRTAAADAMYLEPSRVWLLVAALKNGDVQPWTLAFTHRRQLDHE